MGYRLRFSGAQYVSFASSISIDLGLAAYVVEFRLVVNAAPSSFYAVIGRNGTSAGFFIMPSLSLAGYTSGTLRYQTAASFILADGAPHTYRLEHDAGGAWRAYRDGTLFSSGSFTFSTVAAPIVWIGQGNNSSNSFLSGDLEYVDVQGVTNGQKWSADLSNGAGSTLPTVSGSNQGTLNGFSVPSCWIFYSAGGTSYDGGAATNYAIDTSAGGQLSAAAGAVVSFALASAGGVSRVTSNGAAASYGLDSAGGVSRTSSNGAAITMALDTSGGGDVITGATIHTGGAAVVFAAASGGGGSVIRAGGALVAYSADTSGGVSRTTSNGAPTSYSADTSGGVSRTTNNGSAITVTLITSGGGDVVGPGYKPTVTAPAVAVRRNYTCVGLRVEKTKRAAYTVAIKKTYRGQSCRL